jgi:hypothetical protein
MRSAPLACAVLATQVLFAVTIAFGAPCGDGCPDDGPDGRCPPACVGCPCSPRPAPAASPLAIVTPPDRVRAVAVVATHAPFEPAPADIFHVPRRLLA